MRYQDFIYDKDDPAEVADRPPRFDIADPMLPERLALEKAIETPEHRHRAMRYGQQAAAVSAIFHTLNRIEPHPEAVSLDTGVTFCFTALSAVPRAEGDPWAGHRSPALSRLRLLDLRENELAEVIVSLWRDREAWTQPCWGHALSDPGS